MEKKTESGFSEFIESLEGKTAVIVYSYSNAVKSEDTWYDRWRSDTVAYYGGGVEALGMEARYVDVETYLRLMSEQPTIVGDFIINLHSGLKRIGSWPIISSLASWRRIPIVPCDSDAHIVGERKDLTNYIADSTAILSPNQFQTKDKSRYVIKPRDLGMSVGLKLTSDRNEIARSKKSPELIVQKFVPGYDATMAFLKSYSGEYICIGGMMYCPEVDNVEDWMLREHDKNEATKVTSYTRIHIEVDAKLSAETSKLISKIGDSSVYRVDFRLASNESKLKPRFMSLENSYFLEANPTPAISPTASVGEMLLNTYEKKGTIFRALTERISSKNKICSPAALLLSNQLYASHNSFQR